MSFGVHSTTSCLGFTVLYLFSFVNIYTCFLFHLLQKDSSIENLYLIASFASWFVSCIFLNSGATIVKIANGLECNKNKNRNK